MTSKLRDMFAPLRLLGRSTKTSKLDMNITGLFPGLATSTSFFTFLTPTLVRLILTSGRVDCVSGNSIDFYLIMMRTRKSRKGPSHHGRPSESVRRHPIAVLTVSPHLYAAYMTLRDRVRIFVVLYVFVVTDIIFMKMHTTLTNEFTR